MKKTLALVFLILFLVASAAYSWEKATHAYVVDQMKDLDGPHKLAKIYGTMAPDIFNYAFDLPPALYDYLHFETHNNFMKGWNAVEEKDDESFAFGFVCHNDVWGADFAAHWEAMTTGIPEGYIITKAKILHEILLHIEEYEALGELGVDYDTYIELNHSIAEAAGDIIIKRADPAIGAKIMASAHFHDEFFRSLLLRAYLTDLASIVGDEQMAQEIILGYEDWFRQNMVIGYGQLLQEKESVVINEIVEDFNVLVGAYLASKGITLPPGMDLRPLIYFALTAAISLCEPDYMMEVEATIDFVKEQLELHGIIN
ncbi:MAG: hypothetical protein ACFFCW_38965 [Candidatus Hodarchaeota archaeon]